MYWRFYSSLLFILLGAAPVFAEWEQWQGTVVIHEGDFSGPVNISWVDGEFNFKFTAVDGTVLSSRGTLQDAGGGSWILRSVYADCVIGTLRTGDVIVGQEIIQCDGQLSNLRITK